MYIRVKRICKLQSHTQHKKQLNRHYVFSGFGPTKRLGGNIFAVVSDFVYLGSLVNNDNSVQE